MSQSVVHIISVGEPGHNDSVFLPQLTTANVGDTIQFQFKSGNHTASKGIFGFPCLVNGTGFFSGFMPVTQSKGIPTYTIDILDLEPIYFFSAAGDECQRGRVGGINTPSEGNTLALYQVSAEQLGKYAVSGLPSLAVSPSTSTVEGVSSSPTLGSIPISTASIKIESSQITSTAGRETSTGVSAQPGAGKSAGNMSTGEMAAIVVGAAALLVIGAVLGIFWRRKFLERNSLSGRVKHAAVQ